MFGIQKSVGELTPCDACPLIPATGTPRRNARVGVSLRCPWIRLLCLSQAHVGLCKQRNFVVNVREAPAGCFVMLEITSVRTRSEPGKSERGLRENSRKIINCGLFKTAEEDKNVPEGEADLTSLVLEKYSGSSVVTEHVNHILAFCTWRRKRNTCSSDAGILH